MYNSITFTAQLSH